MKRWAYKTGIVHGLFGKSSADRLLFACWAGDWHVGIYKYHHPLSSIHQSGEVPDIKNVMTLLVGKPLSWAITAAAGSGFLL